MTQPVVKTIRPLCLMELMDGKSKFTKPDFKQMRYHYNL